MRCDALADPRAVQAGTSVRVAHQAEQSTLCTVKHDTVACGTPARQSGGSTSAGAYASSLRPMPSKPSNVSGSAAAAPSGVGAAAVPETLVPTRNVCACPHSMQNVCILKGLGAHRALQCLPPAPVQIKRTCTPRAATNSLTMSPLSADSTRQGCVCVGVCLYNIVLEEQGCAESKSVGSAAVYGLQAMPRSTSKVSTVNRPPGGILAKYSWSPAQVL